MRDREELSPATAITDEARYCPLMSPLSDDRPDLEPGDAARACVEELGKVHSDYQRAQVYATLALREAVEKVTNEIRLASRR